MSKPLPHMRGWKFLINDKVLDPSFTKWYEKKLNHHDAYVFVELNPNYPPNIKCIGFFWEFSNDVKDFRCIRFTETGYIVGSRVDDKSYVCAPASRQRVLDAHKWTRELLQDLIDYTSNLGIHHPTLFPLLKNCIVQMEDALKDL